MKQSSIDQLSLRYDLSFITNPNAIDFVTISAVKKYVKKVSIAEEITIRLFWVGSLSSV